MVADILAGRQRAPLTGPHAVFQEEKSKGNRIRTFSRRVVEAPPQGDATLGDNRRRKGRQREARILLRFRLFQKFLLLVVVMR